MPHEGGTIPSDLTDPGVNIETGAIDRSLTSEVGRLLDPNQMTQFEADLGLVGTSEGMATPEEQAQSYENIINTPGNVTQSITGGLPSSEDVQTGVRNALIAIVAVVGGFLLLSSFAKGAGRGVTE